MRPREKPPKNGVPCAICGKPTTMADRNTDETYTHRECLYGTSSSRLK